VACSSCRWRFPVPTFLTGEDARAAYDRLAVKLQEHRCEARPWKNLFCGLAPGRRTLRGSSSRLPSIPFRVSLGDPRVAKYSIPPHSTPENMLVVISAVVVATHCFRSIQPLPGRARLPCDIHAILNPLGFAGIRRDVIMERSPNGPWNAGDRCEYPAQSFSLGARRAFKKSPTVSICSGDKSPVSSLGVVTALCDREVRSFHAISLLATAKRVFCFPLNIPMTTSLP
jgi:hypothetical protein